MWPAQGQWKPPHGLAVLDQRSGQSLPAEQAALPAALHGRINSFCRVSDSVAWVATDRGLLRVHAAGPAGGGCWLARDARHARSLLYLGAENIAGRLARVDADLLADAA